MDETSTAERLKPNLASGNTQPGFLILIVMMIGAALGLLLLNTYQQNIRTRFQSSAFLQNQLFFLELNRFVPHLIDHFRKQSLEQLTENRIPLEASDLPQELQHWNLESLLEGKPAQHLEVFTEAGRRVLRLPAGTGKTQPDHKAVDPLQQQHESSPGTGCDGSRFPKSA